MKLPDFRSNVRMNALREAMGIPHDQFGSLAVEIAPGRLTLDELRKLTSGDGIDVDFKELTILPDGTLAYKDSRVLLYIRDHHLFSGEFNAPKYHFFNCRTLVWMRETRRIDRYVVATEVTGSFRINIIENRQKKSEHHKLSVCQNCLDGKAFDGFSLQSSKQDRDRFVEEFLPDRFFAVYPRSLIEIGNQQSAATAPLNDYPENWGVISRNARNSANWTCSVCGLILKVHKKKYLHVHHRNGVRSDVRPENLQVLCLGCHAEEPQHQMKSSPVYKEFIKATGWRRVNARTGLHRAKK